MNRNKPHPLFSLSTVPLVVAAGAVGGRTGIVLGLFMAVATAFLSCRITEKISIKER